METLIDYVDHLVLPLQNFAENLPPAPATFVRKEYTGSPGRPQYQIDLDRAVLLHNLNISWDQIAYAMGIVCRTLYQHLNNAVISTS